MERVANATEARTGPTHLGMKGKAEIGVAIDEARNV